MDGGVGEVVRWFGCGFLMDDGLGGDLEYSLHFGTLLDTRSTTRLGLTALALALRISGRLLCHYCQFICSL